MIILFCFLQNYTYKQDSVLWGSATGGKLCRWVVPVTGPLCHDSGTELIIITFRMRCKYIYTSQNYHSTVVIWKDQSCFRSWLDGRTNQIELRQNFWNLGSLNSTGGMEIFSNYRHFRLLSEMDRSKRKKWNYCVIDEFHVDIDCTNSWDEEGDADSWIMEHLPIERSQRVFGLFSMRKLHQAPILWRTSLQRYL